VLAISFSSGEEMKSKTSFKQKLRNIAGAGLIGLAALTSNVKAQEIKPVENPQSEYSIRLRTESDSGEQTRFFKNTFGIAPFSKKGHQKYDEFVRIYNLTGEQKGEHMDYTAWGLISPEFNLGDLENSVSIFGLSGDRKGIGFQSKHSLDKWDLYLNAEKEKLLGKDSTRIGFGVDYNFGEKFNPGIGFDRVKTSKGITDYVFGKLVVNATDTDQYGVGIRVASGADETHKIGVYYMHHGKEEPSGSRTRFYYDWNNETDFRGMSFESIIVENPTFSKSGSGPALVGRNQNYLFSKQLFESAPLVVERAPLGERARNGWVNRIAGNFKDNAGENSGYLEGNLGYTFKPDESGIKPSLIGIYKHVFSEKEDCDYIGASALLHFNKNFCLEATYTQPISGDGKPKAYVSACWIKSF